MNHRIVLLLSVCLVSLSAYSQEQASWKVVLNKKVILNGTGQEDTVKNKLFLKKGDLSNNGIFKIEYTEPKNSVGKGWERTIAIMDTVSLAIIQRDSATILQVYNKDMLKILWSRKRVNVYTWAKPLDPGVAAAVRIRRFHLCTLELVD